MPDGQRNNNLFHRLTCGDSESTAPNHHQPEKRIDDDDYASVLKLMPEQKRSTFAELQASATGGRDITHFSNVINRLAEKDLIRTYYGASSVLADTLLAITEKGVRWLETYNKEKGK